MNVPEVRGEVHPEDGKEAFVVDGGANGAEPDEDTDNRHDDLAVMMGREDDR